MMTSMLRPELFLTCLFENQTSISVVLEPCNVLLIVMNSARLNCAHQLRTSVAALCLYNRQLQYS